MLGRFDTPHQPPADRAWHPLSCAAGALERRRSSFVIPAKAGIQPSAAPTVTALGPGLRRDDDLGFTQVQNSENLRCFAAVTPLLSTLVRCCYPLFF